MKAIADSVHVALRKRKHEQHHGGLPAYKKQARPAPAQPLNGLEANPGAVVAAIDVCARIEKYEGSDLFIMNFNW